MPENLKDAGLRGLLSYYIGRIMNPWKAILDIRPGERAFSLLMMAYFFLVITTFWILKPLKKAAFVGFYKDHGFQFLGLHFNAADAELWAKVANMLVAAVAVTLFTALAKRYRKQELTFIFSAFFGLAFFLLQFWIHHNHSFVAWTFYLMGDLYSTLMVATFFIFLNDSVTSDSAKRLYGLVGLGGVLGGAFGSITVRSLIKQESITHTVWLFICLGITFLIALLAKLAAQNTPQISRPAPRSLKPDSTRGTNPAWEGAKLVFRSPYLFSIVAIVGLYEIVSTLVDYQFTRTLLHFVEKPKLGEAFGTAYVWMNITAVVVQIFLTSFIMKKFGIKAALFVLPLALIIISGGYLVAPVIGIAMLMPSADGGLAYSLNQSAKEALYVPTSKDEKYKAKAFIDMFVQRFAKVVAIGVTLVVTSIFKDFSTVRWLSLGTVVILVFWLIAVNYAGRKFAESELTATPPPEDAG